MNLNRRETTYVSGKEYLYTTAGAIMDAVTLDATKFSGEVKAGTALSIQANGKAKPWEDTDTGRAVILDRTEKVDGQDIVSTCLIAGIVRAAKCTGLTDAFKQKTKNIEYV
jgi:hypothetical protein